MLESNVASFSQLRLNKGGEPRLSGFKPLIPMLSGLFLAALSSAAFAAQHSICYEGDLTASLQATAVYACREDAGGYCLISPSSPGMHWISSYVPGNAPGSFGVYQLDATGSVSATIRFFDSHGALSGTRNCMVNTIGRYGYGVVGGATRGAVLTGFTTDASGLLSTGVWKFVSPTLASYNRQTVRVPLDFVAVGGGAMGAEYPYGALVTESLREENSPSASWRGWTARTSDLLDVQPHHTTVYAIGMRIAGIDARDLKPLLSVVNQDSSPAATAHPVNQVSFPTHSQSKFVFLSGGVKALADTSNSPTMLGQFVTATAPIVVTGGPSWCPQPYNQCALPFVNGWQVASKDHLVSHPGTVNTNAIAMPPKLVVGGQTFQVVGNVVSATSAIADHPAAEASGLLGQYALTGIGAAVDWNPVGNLIWKLEPRPDIGGAAVASKDHRVVSQAGITAYALGVKLEKLPSNYGLGAQGFALDQTIPFTGTSPLTNTEGTPVPVNSLPGAAEAKLDFYLPSQRNVAANFGFWFTYSSGPSTMMLDARFVLDGVATTPWRRFQTAASQQLQDLFYSVPAGQHTIAVEVRSVLAGGPPTQVRLCGNYNCYYSNQRTEASLSAGAR